MDRCLACPACCAVLLLLVAAPLFADWDPAVTIAENDTACHLALGNCWGLAACGDTLHAVWYEAAYASYDIFYRRSLDNGTTWQPEVRICDDTVYSGYPAVAVAGSFVHVVWVQGIDARGDSGDQVWYRRSTDCGATWETAFQFSHSTGGYYGGWFPCIVTEDACVHVAWEDDRSGDDMVYYRRSTNNGTTWNTENPVLNQQGYVNPTLAASGSTIHIAYYNFRSEVVYFQRSTDNGTTWSAKTGIPTPDVSDAPCLGSTGDTVHLAYCDGRNGHWDVWYRRSTDAGLTWSADTCIMPDIYQTWTCNLAVSGSNVHVVRGDMGGYQVHYIRSTDAGLTWGPERCLSESVPGRDAMHYSVAAADSNVHVIFDKENWVYYRRSPGGNPVAVQKPLAGSPRAVPKPSLFAKRLRIRGRETELFETLDISGRRVGIFPGAAVGFGLPAGVYLVRSLAHPAERWRVVKVR